MTTTAATLEILVNARTASAVSSLRRMDQSARTSGTHLQNLDRRTGTLTRTLGRVGRAAVGAAAGYVGLSAAKTAITTTADLAKTTLSLQKNMGFSAKTASELGANLKIRGSDAKAASMAFATFAGVLHQAGQGSASASDRLAELGISGKILQRDLKDPQKALFDVSEGLKNLGSGVQRTDDQRKLFGRGWQALSPILRGGADELKKNLDMADQMGASFSGLGVKNMQDFIEAEHQAQLGMIGLQIGFTQTLGPALITAMDQFSQLAKNIREKGFVPAISEAITNAANRAGEMAPKVFEAFVSGFAQAGVGGQLALGGILLAKFGGLSGFGKLGSGAGRAWGLGFIAAVGALELGKVISDAIKGHPIAQTTTEEFDQQLQKLFPGLEASIGRHGLTLATSMGSLIFSPETKKVIAVHGKQLRDFVGLTAQQATDKFKVITGGGIRGASQGVGIGLDELHKVWGTKLGKIAGLTQKDMRNVTIEMRRGPEQGRAATVNVLDKLIGNYATAMNKAGGATKRGMDFIAQLLSARLRAVGATVPADFPRLQKVGGGKGSQPIPKDLGLGRQRGGRLSGPMAGDRIPVMAEGGEYVVNSKATSRFLPLLENINQAVPRFAGGGQIPSFAGRSPGVVDDIAAGELNIFAAAARRMAQRSGGVAAGGKGLASVIANANRMNALHQPYLWGGGHGGTASRKGPWDCSGAISELLAGSVVPGFSPVVSGGFTSMFQPGAGPLSIYANASHVFASIGGKGFGTSAENPGGGAGWISYSSRPGFAVRHVPLVGDTGRKTGKKSRKGDPAARGFQRGGQIFGGSLNVDQLTTLAKYVGAPHAETMGAIAMAESKGDPHAMGKAGDKGLWQIIPSTAANFGVPYGALFDPIKNARGMNKIVRGQGLSAWSTYNSGAYRHFMGGNVKPGLLATLRGGKGTTGGAGGTADAGGGGTGIPMKLLLRLHRQLIGPAQKAVATAIHAAKQARNVARKTPGVADDIAAFQALTGAMGTRKDLTTKIGAWKKAKQSGKGERAALEALTAAEQALLPGATEDTTGTIDDALAAEQDRIRAINEIISSENLAALQTYQVGASQNPLLGLLPPNWPQQTLLGQIPSSLPVAPGAGGGGGSTALTTGVTRGKISHHHTHVHIDGKQVAHVIRKENKRESRRGHRPLPSSRRS